MLSSLDVSVLLGLICTLRTDRKNAELAIRELVRRSCRPIGWFQFFDCLFGIRGAAVPMVQVSLVEAAKRNGRKNLDELVQIVEQFVTEYGDNLDPVDLQKAVIEFVARIK